jgi:elongation factor 1 alpha-like protein
MPPKSGFSRTRNVDYDDDDAYDDDDYYEEEADGAAGGDSMTEDDKEQMREGTIRVREALGDVGDFTSDEQIQEALWHYYYNIEKSVSYLKNKLGVETKQEAPKKEKPKTTSRFDQAASVADQNAPQTAGKYPHTHTQFSCAQELACPVAHHLPLPFVSMPTNAAATDFFWDVPWGNVPPERMGIITIDAPLYQSGLLGGSSKLATLAAKRRKDREDAEAAASKAKNDADSAVAMLDKLSVQSKENANPSQRGGDAEDARSSSRASRYPIRRRSPSPKPKAPKELEEDEPQAPQPAVVVESPAQRATASMFASTLCGPDNVPKQSPSQLRDSFAAYKSRDAVDAFSGPSPDDVVRAARAKGAGGGRH